MKIILALIASLAPLTAAHAQVYKCVEDGTGKITYSQSPCYGKDSGRYLDLKPANTFDGGHLRRRADADTMQRQVDTMQRQAEARPSSRGGAIGDGRAQDEAEWRRSLACEDMKRPPSGGHGMTSSQRRAMLAACTGIVLPPDPIPAPSRPRSVASCDDGGCWDDQGNRYARGAGNVFFPPSGGACQLSGRQLHCP